MYNFARNQPTSNSFGSIFLDYSILQSLMISIQKKLLRKKIVSPLLQCLNYSIKLLIINIIFSFCIIQLLTKISNRSTFLAQNSSYCSTTRSRSTWNTLLGLGSAIIGYLVTFYFNRLKLLSSPTVHLNSFLSPLIVSVKGPQILLKFLINFL